MFELFHAISDAKSARVRKYIVDHELTERVRFRNVTYDEVKQDLAARGGVGPPALWDGAVLITDVEAIIAKLEEARAPSP